MYMIMLECFFLVVLVYFIFFLIFYKEIMDSESMTPYECGFDPNSLTRMTFSYRFFLISILFMIFDVEISLMLPIPFLSSSSQGIFIFNIFIFILIIGLLYEYFYGSLDWLDT